MLAYLLLALIIEGILGEIQLHSLNIPSHTMAGESILMDCAYDLNGEDMYSVKWYKETDEFYRYVPKDKPPAQNFLLPGVDVDMDKSNDRSVLLRNVGVNTSGRYKCEISAEAPSFKTIFKEKEMLVVAPPNEGPKITGGRSRYKIGDQIHVNCTSLKSKPAANLTWYINNKPVPEEAVRWYPSLVDQEGLETSVLGLQFRVNEQHFQNSMMSLRCSANIATVYQNNCEVSVVGDQQPAAVLESKGSPNQAKNQSSVMCNFHLFLLTVSFLATLLLLR